MKMRRCDYRVMWPQTTDTWIHQKLEEARNRFLLRTFREWTALAHTLISDFWTSELWKNTFLLFEATKFEASYYGSHRKLIHPPQRDILCQIHWGWSFAKDGMFVFPPKFTCWNLNPHCDGIRRWPFGKWWGYEGRSLTNGISALKNGTTAKKTTVSLLPYEVTEREWPSELESRLHQT